MHTPEAAAECKGKRFFFHEMFYAHNLRSKSNQKKNWAIHFRNLPPTPRFLLQLSKESLLVMMLPTLHQSGPPDAQGLWAYRCPCHLLSQSVQFSRSVVSDSCQPHGLQHTRPPCPSPAPGAYSNSCPLSRWCHRTISSSVILLLPSIFPSITYKLMYLSLISSISLFNLFSFFQSPLLLCKRRIWY